MNDIEQGMPRCDKCFEVLPCHDHPAPPKLTIIKPEMVRIETSEGTIECAKQVVDIITETFNLGDVLPVPDDDCIFPLEQSVHTDWPNLDCHFPDTDTDGTAIPEPARVSEMSEKEKSNVVNFTGETILDVKPELICEEALKRKPGLLVVMGYDEQGDEFFLWSSADTHTNNFLLDRAKMAIMEAYDGDED